MCVLTCYVPASLSVISSTSFFKIGSIELSTSRKTTNQFYFPFQCMPLPAWLTALACSFTVQC